MRKNEHPGCSCRACRRGKHAGGRFIVVMINRRLRRLYRSTLRRGTAEDVPIVLSTPYTD
jgi:hypothetical protein